MPIFAISSRLFGHARRVALAAGVVAGALALPASAAPGKGPDSVADLAEGIMDAVVNISTAQNAPVERSVPVPKAPEGSPFQEFFDEFFNKNKNKDNTPRRVQSLGSGFVIDASGIIVTNNHVIDGADEITANFNDGTKLKAELIGKDTKIDIAVLRVKPTKPIKAVKFGNSDKARVGDWVLAIGNPFGLGGTVTIGIVSARNRDINAGPYDNFIQTDAAINRGNSGGPLFNMDGDVIGINTAIISPTGGSIGIGFSIPANTAAAVVDQLLQYGETRRGWLGVRIQGVTDDIADSLGLKEAKGALVAGVTEKGPADAAGIQAGDVILKFDGKTVPSVRELPRMVADTPVQKEVDVVVLRKGAEVPLKVKLGRLEEGEKQAALEKGGAKPPEAPKPQPTVTTALGLSLAELTPELRTKFKIKDSVAKGVVVAEVASGSPAADRRIVPGDVILEVGQEAVGRAEDIVKRLDALKKDGRKRALLLIANPEGEMRFATVAIE
ncbi:DegQ family serine endoprotease [Methyloraptor flagellatus]|uniref:Probable periplasmic serine endoprotease DegP-like n=1 Tax=Methyloraptor flagellatus TaxID=3162530 RepID=A0AAU7XCW5_9HYPH